MAFKQNNTAEKEAAPAPQALQGTSISDQAKQAAGLPAKVPQAGGYSPPEFLGSYAEQDAGIGVSKAAEDNLVPTMYLLQALNPQVDRRNSAYVEGAEAGDIWFRNAPPGLELLRGEVGTILQPCYFYQDVVEREPTKDGKGVFVRRWGVRRAKEVTGAKPGHDRETGEADPNAWFTADGQHDLVEYRNHVVLLHAGGRLLPYLMPLKSTGHTFSRGWMSKYNDKLIQSGPKKGEPYPSFACLYRITTEQQERNGNRWFNFKAQDHDWCSEDLYLAGRRLSEQFKTGEKKGEEPVDEGNTTKPAVNTAKVDATV